MYQSNDPFPFPLTVGIYDTSPKMARLYLKNGTTHDDLPEFVIDSHFLKYIEAKLRNLNHAAHRYRVFQPSLNDNYLLVAKELFLLIAQKDSTICTVDKDKAYFFNTDITVDIGSGEISSSSKSDVFITQKISSFLKKTPMPARIFDALALHIQEDFAVTARDLEQKLPNDYLELAHIAFPSHWDPRKKIGKHFSDIHKPVANNDRLIRAHHTLINSMFERGPFTRFVWGVTFTDDLDRHPEHIFERNETLPKNQAELVERAHLRVERQITYPLLSINRSLFTIRVFIKPIKEIKKDSTHRMLLRDALGSMNEEALRYKGLTNYRDHLVDWLSIAD